MKIIITHLLICSGKNDFYHKSFKEMLLNAIVSRDNGNILGKGNEVES